VRFNMAYKIDEAKCSNCGTCDSECPVEAISENNGKRTIDTAKCVDCGSCSGVCPVEAIAGE
jgi:heterodisulfide reductase subunit A-like polyferredoxin